MSVARSCYTLPIKFIINSFPKRNSLQYPLQAVFSFSKARVALLALKLNVLIYKNGSVTTNG